MLLLNNQILLRSKRSSQLLPTVIYKSKFRSSLFGITSNLNFYNKQPKTSLYNFSSSSSSAAVTYEIAQIKKDGQMQYRSKTIEEILRGSSMHARDLFSLNLTSTQMSGKKASRLVRPSAAILPREDDILVSLKPST